MFGTILQECQIKEYYPKEKNIIANHLFEKSQIKKRGGGGGGRGMIRDPSGLRWGTVRLGTDRGGSCV